MEKHSKSIYKWFFTLMAFGMFTLFSVSAYGQSVETRPKVASDQEPAFPQQTRVQGVQTESNFSVDILTDELSTTWGLDFLPDGRMIVSERPGTIRIVTRNGEISDPLEGVPPVRTEGVGGLMDIKLAPDFEQSRLVFWTYVEPADNDNGTTSVARARLSADETALEDVQVIYRSVSTPDVFHFGSRMLFDNDGSLFVTIGDRYEDSVRIQAQELDSSIGKIIRINQDGTPAQDNPFTSNPDALHEIWSLGHRNPQGLAFNPVTGDLWASEHGPRSGDEINVIQPGENYGWPEISYGLEDDGGPVNGTGLTQQEGMKQPVYYWDPAVAPSGMTFYTGDAIPEWENNLFVGALRGSHIIRLVIDHSVNWITGEERLLADKNQRFRYVVQGPDGALYATTDQGRIYRIGN